MPYADDGETYVEIVRLANNVVDAHQTDPDEVESTVEELRWALINAGFRDAPSRI